MDHCLSPQQLRARLAGPEPPLLIDVGRRPGFVCDPTPQPGAVWRDPEAIEMWAGALPRRREVVVFCVHGHSVGRDVRDTLRRRGIDAAMLAGGLTAWQVARSHDDPDRGVEP
jgi:Fe-Mn family superoxide dismutase